MLKKTLVVILSLMLLLPSISVFAQSGDYPNDWSKETIQRGIDMGIVPDRLQSKYFDPITREEFAELLVNAAFMELEMTGYEHIWSKSKVLEYVTIDQPFDDTDLDHVKLAYIMGSINGTTETTFSPDSFITREQAAQMLMNTVHRTSILIYATEEEMGYADYDKINEWAIPAVSAAYTIGLMKGSNGEFMPFKNITREQAIVTIMRMMDYTDYDILQLRGDISALPVFDDLRYNLGKDYVYVSYVDDGYGTSEKLLQSSWISYDPTKDLKTGYHHEQALVIYAFNSNLLNRDYPWISDAALRGESAKVDYGYMIVETFTDDYLYEFKLKDILGYSNVIAGHKYGYPKVDMNPKPIN
ncbi:S-layer homology domain-containing protein [Bacillus sp. SM2101]|uniref:S-layer homology domain-containing protein n=1 Tax=Bacillus sp. SM2101 TaxID=2805366 RepID=UPI001BDF23FE|nr:S-layer homology domain-containing protein [Bacillus sp. SM2101]